MKVLLDTHVFIWSATRKSLSPTATAVFLDSANELYFSLASYWEIAIKVSLGKLVLDAKWMQQIDEEMVANSIQWLPIAKEHCQQVTALPHLHGDPFDRLLIAQAMVEQMTLMTADDKITQYPIPIVW